MGHGYQKKGLLLIPIFVLAFGLMFEGAAPAQEKATSTQPKAESKVTLKPFGPGGPVCNDFEPVPNDKKQKVSISIDTKTKPPSIEFDSEKCVQETVNGSLTFYVAKLPAKYRLEIDFQTRYDSNGKPHKGPFKSKNPTPRYPSAGRCVMDKAPDDSCVFDQHDTTIPIGDKFQFNVFLWDEFGNLADEVDPGVMVVDTP